MAERSGPSLIDLPGARRRKVLVVDDEPSLSSLIEDWLSDFFEVLVSFNARAAIQKAVWQKPDLILMDMVLPDMTGFEAVRFLQADPQTRSIPVIVMTSKSFDDSTIQMIKSEPNVRGFLNKPFRPTELMKMVEAVVKGQKTVLDVKAPPSAVSPPSPVALRAAPPGLASPPSAYPPAPMAAPAPTTRPARPPSPPTPPPTAETPFYRPTSPKPAPLRDPPPAPPSPPVRPPQRPAGGGAARRPVVDDAAADPRSGGASPARRWFFILGGAVALAATAVVLAEWTARSMRAGLGADFFFPPVQASSDAALPYAFRPGSAWMDGDETYRINSWGLRGAEFPVVAPEGITRIYLLGGALVFGEGVREEETVARLLEERWNARVGDGARVQVINGGLWGHSPAEQWAFYMKNGLQFRPKILIWVCENKNDGLPSGVGVRRLASASAPLGEWVERSQLYRLWKSRMLRRSPDEPTPFASLRTGPAAVAAEYPTQVFCVPLPPEPASAKDPLVLPLGADYRRITSVESSPGMTQLLARWIDEALRDVAVPANTP
jgi:CheY-like chemotaxis protein